MDFSQFFGALPVVLTMAIVQIIKTADQKDTFERFYFLVAIAVGTLIGAFFSQALATATDFAGWLKVAQDGFMNAVWSCFVWLFKKPLGIRFPGDPAPKDGQGGQ